MPATTLEHLQLRLGSAGQNSTNFLEAGGDFSIYVNEVGPRIYAMGPWRDLLAEKTYGNIDGYISIDREYEAVLSATVNNRPQRVHGMFHDSRNLGVASTLSEKWGLIDQGYHPVRRDLASISPDPVSVLYLCDPVGTAVTPAQIRGGGITVEAMDDTGREYTGLLDEVDGVSVITFPEPVSLIMQIISDGRLPFTVDIRTDPEDTITTIARLGRNLDVVRYRRFRIGGRSEDSYVHLLLKRAWQDVCDPDDKIFLGNLSAWKHAMLGKVYEDNADVQRAEYHWGSCQKILDTELSAHQGAAKPMIQLDMYGGAAGPIRNLY
jgi:hypothetical protein